MKKVLTVAMFALAMPLGAAAQVPPPLEAGDPTPKMCEQAAEAEKRAEKIFEKVLRKVTKANKRNQVWLTKARKAYEDRIAKLDARTLEQCDITAREYKVDDLRCLLE